MSQYSHVLFRCLLIAGQLPGAAARWGVVPEGHTVVVTKQVQSSVMGHPLSQPYAVIQVSTVSFFDELL